MENPNEVPSNEGCWDFGVNGYTFVYFFDSTAGFEEKWKKGKDGFFFNHGDELGSGCFTCDFSRNAGTWTIS